MRSAKRLWIGVILAFVGVGFGVLRITAGIEGLSALGGLCFLAGIAVVAWHFVAPQSAERAAAFEGNYTGATAFHRAILEALIAAHPPGVGRVRVVLHGEGGKYDADISTLDRKDIPPSVRRPIEGLAAFLVSRGEPLDRLILQAELNNDGTWRHEVEVGRESLRR